MNNKTIDELIELCKTKNERAQMEVYRRYHLAMYHSALRIVQQPVDAEDVMHDGFLTAFEKLEQYKGNNKFGGWLKQITLRKALNFCEMRNKANKTTLNEDVLATETPTENEDGQAKKRLEAAMNQLNPRYRNALILMYYEGYDYEEIGSILKMSYGNCRTLISRAKEQLKQKINAHEPA